MQALIQSVAIPSSSVHTAASPAEPKSLPQYMDSWSSRFAAGGDSMRTKIWV